MSAAATFGPVLVTGGSGFVGANLVRSLLSQGFEVHVLLRSAAPGWRLRDVSRRFRIHQADLVDERAVREIVRAVRPTCVQHLATHGAYENQADARSILQTNVLGTHNLLEASAEFGVRVFVSTGSSSEYGFKDSPMRECDVLEPNSFYSVAKSTQTHLCTLFARRSAMATVTFRLFSIYGPWEEPTRLIPTLLRRSRVGLPLEMTSPETARDFVYVDDVTRALTDLPRLAALKGEVINLASGVETRLRDVVGLIQRTVGANSEVRWGAMQARHWDTSHWSGDATKAARLLEWRPLCTLAEGLERTARWMELGNAQDASNQVVAA